MLAATVMVDTESPRLRVWPNGSLVITAARDTDEGMYLCEANNGIEPAISKVIQLKVHAAASMSIRNLTTAVKEGDRGSLKCEVRGDSPLYVSWEKNGYPVSVTPGGRFIQKDVQRPHGMLSELIIEKSERTDEGQYTCTAWNSFGKDTTVIIFTVKQSPAASDNVKIIDHSSRDVRLTWQSPEDGGAPLIRFVVQYKLASEEWTSSLPNVTVIGEDSSAKVSGLLPGTSYSFRVLAENALGFGPPSAGVGITTSEEAPAGPPVELSAKPLSSEALLITWKPPLKQRQNGDILGYHITYRPLNSSESPQLITIESLNRDNKADNHPSSQSSPLSSNIFNNPSDSVPVAPIRIPKKDISSPITAKLIRLNKYTPYVVSIQAYNRAGKGPVSEEIIGTTDEDVPEKAPEKIKCKGVSSQSLNVTWIPPPKNSQHGIITGYKILYWAVSNEDANFFKSIARTSEQFALLHNLQKYSNYSVQILAITKAGDGQTSDPIYCNTLEDVPGPPGDIKVAIKSTSEVVAVWKAPPKPNGNIIKYTLYMRQPLERKPSTKRFTVLSPRTSFEISVLDENQRYEFWVTASTTMGEGQSTKVASQTPQSQVPARILAFSDKLLKDWTEDIYLACPMVGTPIPAREWLKGRNRIRISDGMSVTSDGYLVIRSAQRSHSASYTCRVENAYGNDQITTQVIVQAPPDSPVVNVTAVTASTMQLTWKVVDDGGAPVRGYYVRHKREFSEWEKAEIPRNVFKHSLQNLRCGTHYQISVSAFNRIGEGKHSDITQISTTGAPPGIPKAEDVLLPNSTSAVLRLSIWPTGGCPVHYFVLKYRAKYENEWTLIANNAQPQQETLLIPDLRPSEAYELHVTAHNDAGSTVFVFPFVTMNGQQNQHDAIAGARKPSGYYQDLGLIILLSALLVAGLIVIAGVGIVAIRRRRYSGYRNTKASVPSDTTNENHDVAEQKRLHCNNPATATSCLPSYYADTQNQPKHWANDEISPYATFNVPLQYQPEKVSDSISLQSPIHLRKSRKPDEKGVHQQHFQEVTRGMTNSSAAVDISKPHSVDSDQNVHFQDLILHRSSIPEIPNRPPNPSHCNRPVIFSDRQVFIPAESYNLEHRKLSSEEWEMQRVKAGLVSYLGHVCNQDQMLVLDPNTPIPDLLYRGTDSSTPPDSSPEDVHRLNTHSGIKMSTYLPESQQPPRQYLVHR